MKREINGELLNVPEHVAVIMDGNGRWAKKRFLPRNYGHAEGAKALEAICENCDKLGIKYLTVYAFSTENWKRSVEEVTGIMNLFRKYLVDSIERSNNSNMKVNLIGKREGLPEDIVQKMDDLERETAGNTGLQFHIAINYGGRDEIVRAVKKIMPVSNELTVHDLQPLARLRGVRQIIGQLIVDVRLARREDRQHARHGKQHHKQPPFVHNERRQTLHKRLLHTPAPHRTALPPGIPLRARSKPVTQKVKKQ